jgi:tetratricopeptide (TPR) repeat protein
MRRFLGTACALAVLAGALHAARGAPTASSAFQVALEAGRKALAAGHTDEARRQVERALERDDRSPDAWALSAQVAQAAGRRDERVYALHEELALRIAQGAPRKQVRALREHLRAVDPIAHDYLTLGATWVDRLMALAKAYRKAKRPHSAIRVYQEVLALDPERGDAQRAIEEISAAPDPSLAATAKPKDLLADVSKTWIDAFDAQHATWDTRAKLVRENYTTYTDAGYEVMVRCAEAMEHMNAFYRQFFHYGVDDGKKVPHIDLNIFAQRDTYLHRGIGPPVDWSKGHFTGGAVEVWIGDSGFQAMTGTLFHEAAHQFVSLATNAVGWLNEGLACFFEGCRIQPNGTVLMNRPATGRLFALAGRMEKGWMQSAKDGIDPVKPSASHPPKAPTFRILIEDDYAWGPPWYAPTWGLVYFLYNVQDPLDGRFLYRNAFRTYVDSSGGKRGKSAIGTFEKVVLAHPEPLTKSLRKEKAEDVALPTTVDEVDAFWKRWILALRDEQRGSKHTPHPYLAWARYAIERGDVPAAVEHFEKGVRESPHDVDLLEAFADLLAHRLRNRDRAVKLLHAALEVLEAAPQPDARRIATLEARLERLDPHERTLGRMHRALERDASRIAQRYLDAGLYLMAMRASLGLGTTLKMPSLLRIFRQAVERSGKTLARWQLAYDEADLRGWVTGGGHVFQPYGAILRSHFGTPKAGDYAYSFLTLDKVTAGDYALETELQARPGENAFAGLVFGKKSGTAFHALIFFPQGQVDLASFYAAGAFKTWRHEGVEADPEAWHRLRVDVAGRDVDVWFDGRLVASQTFPDREVLQGRFGLITGPGKARFRNVRVLLRDAADPGARIERALRLARSKHSGQRRLGYHLGTVPPWPRVRAWVQAPRTRWDERGFVPTLLVLWSMKQDRLLPLEGWLADVARRYRDVGLQFVSVSEEARPETVTAFLKEHPFPGSVAVDAFDPKKGGTGETMDLYAAGRQGYPWMLLLDIDQKVVWEGNPGFLRSQPWKPGVATHVDAPLADLVARRHLKELGPWLRTWKARGPDVLRSGDVAAAAALLATARTLPGDVVPEVAAAQRTLRDVEGALARLPAVAEAIAGAHAEPALPALLQWADALGVKVDATVRANLEQGFRRGRARAWAHVLRQAQAALHRLARGVAPAGAVGLLRGMLEGRHGEPVPALLLGQVDAALRSGEPAAVRAALEQAPQMPGRWLARDVFGWS